MSIKIAWLTDTHLILPKIRDAQAQEFWSSILEFNPDIIIHTGDIADGGSVYKQLEMAAKTLNCPFYFVMGNHDYYGHRFNDLRSYIKPLLAKYEHLKWLTYLDPIKLDHETVLIGVDGWYDGNEGDWSKSLSLLDYQKIPDLMSDNRWQVIENFADEQNFRFNMKLTEVLQGEVKPKYVIVATHVPPFKEVCFFDGQPQDERGLPVFCNKKMGDILREAAEKNPEINFNVLCGHTHSHASQEILPNLFVVVSGATYWNPEYKEMYWAGSSGDYGLSR